MSKLYHRRLLKQVFELNVYKYKLTSGDCLNDAVYKLGTDVDKNLRTRKSIQQSVSRRRVNPRYGYISDDVLEELGITFADLAGDTED